MCVNEGKIEHLFGHEEEIEKATMHGVFGVHSNHNNQY